MQPRLYVSFWNIELSNLPVGSFRRRVVPMTEARSLIHEARASGTLLCVAKEDLGAPYGERAREKHRELCAALRQYADIEIELKDFFGQNCANPLCFAEVGEQHSLLVVDCHYADDCASLSNASAEAADSPGETAEEAARHRTKSALKMSVAPDSIRFYIFEHVAARAAVLDQMLAAFDPMVHGGEVMSDRSVGRERLPKRGSD